MSPFTKAVLATGAWLKSFRMAWSGSTARWWGSYAILPRTTARYDLAVGDGRNSSLVMSVLMWAARTFPESPVVINQREPDGTVTMVTDHPMLDLLRRPNPYYSGLLLTMATLVDYLALGNAYWLKVRSGAGKPVELWYAPASTVEPRWPDDGSEYISHYDYRPNGGIDPVRVDPADVVHFRYGIDPANTRKGLSLLATVLREVYTDDEASAFTAALLHNLGIPGVVITPAKDEHVDADGAAAIKASFQQRFGGEHRGEPLVLSGPSEVHVLGFTPEQLDLKALRRIPEERISAIFGVPAIVVGLGAGLDRSTFANMAEAREAAYESFIIPLQRLFAAELDSQLLPDFDTRPGVAVGFDLSSVRVLQDDQNALTTRIAQQVGAGLITIGQGRTALGYEAGPEHDVYMLPTSMTLVSAAELEAAATAVAAPPVQPPTVTTIPPAQLPPAKAWVMHRTIWPGAAAEEKAARTQAGIQREMEQRITAAAEAFEATGDRDAFRADMTDAITAGATAAYRLAVGRRLVARDTARLEALIRDQEAYLDGFIADLADYTPGEKGAVSSFAGVLNRALQYVVAAVQGAVFGRLADKEDDDVVTWVTAGDDRVSDTCQEMEGEHTVRELNDGGVFPGVNVDCFSQCRCELI